MRRPEDCPSGDARFGSCKLPKGHQGPHLSPRLEWDSWRNKDDPDDSVRAKAALHLRLIARDVRAAGDIPLVEISGEGVGRLSATLSDELESIAIQLAGLTP